jgi:hypothetical protein
VPCSGVNVRIVAATHQNLEQPVAAGTFSRRSVLPPERLRRGRATGSAANDARDPHEQARPGQAENRAIGEQRDPLIATRRWPCPEREQDVADGTGHAVAERRHRALRRFLDLVFLSTFPVVIPFIVFGDIRIALRASNAVAITMMFTTGYWLARYGGFHPWRTAVSVAVLGIALVAIAIALGG